jgi:hypothetical protein
MRNNIAVVCGSRRLYVGNVDALYITEHCMVRERCELLHVNPGVVLHRRGTVGVLRDEMSLHVYRVAFVNGRKIEGTITDEEWKCVRDALCVFSEQHDPVPADFENWLEALA